MIILKLFHGFNIYHYIAYTLSITIYFNSDKFDDFCLNKKNRQIGKAEKQT